MQVVIFNHSYFYLSETFIYRQIAGLPEDIKATLLSFEFVNRNLFPTTNRTITISRTANFIDKGITLLLPDAIKSKIGFSFISYLHVKKYLKKLKPQGIHVHFGFNARLIYPLAKQLKIPLIISFHGVDASPERMKQDKYKQEVREMIDYASAVIIVSPHMIKTLEISNCAAKTHLIPYGINSMEFKKAGISKKEGQLLILHSGRLVDKKGVPDLIQVFVTLNQKYKDIELVIIGDGPQASMCKEIAGKSNQNNIQFLGAQPQEVVKRYMSMADIFVLNSRTSDTGDMEGLPNAILEAMSMQLAVVSTYHAGIPQAITDNINGLLVNERDNMQLAEAVEKLIVNAELRRTFGEAARKTIEKRFLVDRMNEQIIEVYNRVFGERA